MMMGEKKYYVQLLRYRTVHNTDNSDYSVLEEYCMKSMHLLNELIDKQELPNVPLQCQSVTERADTSALSS